MPRSARGPHTGCRAGQAQGDGLRRLEALVHAEQLHEAVQQQPPGDEAEGVSATSSPTAPRAHGTCERPAVIDLEPAAHPRRGAASALLQAGQVPNSSADKTDRPVAKSRTRPSIVFRPCGDLHGGGRDKDVQRTERDRDPEGAPERRQDQVLDDQLADEPAAARAQRATEAELTLPVRQARQEEVHDVHAADDEHEADGRRHQPQSGLRAARDLVLQRYQRGPELGGYGISAVTRACAASSSVSACSSSPRAQGGRCKRSCSRRSASSRPRARRTASRSPAGPPRRSSHTTG